MMLWQTEMSPGLTFSLTAFPGSVCERISQSLLARISSVDLSGPTAVKEIMDPDKAVIVIPHHPPVFFLAHNVWCSKAILKH